ncbi:Lsr2 family DNA-binding protein [Streptomyces globisporus]|uniref:Lsr2 family DNA-binding protein n=1 Tax=Streptomyces globisporus TaxID=1908 RepID=UPI00345FF57E|nr:Lsr2 family protein [Streptomyces globisporus]
MTVAALLALIEEELPGIPRHPAPRIPRSHFSAKDTTMNTQPEPAARPSAPLSTTAPMAVGALIAWALGHSDRAVRRHGEQAHDNLGWLRTRHAADEELARVDAEERDLEERLAAVRARRAELKPKKPSRDYDAAEVRAWAQAHNLSVPARGQISAAVLEAWRARDTSVADR